MRIAAASEAVRAERRKKVEIMVKPVVARLLEVPAYIPQYQP
jgi:hypothetical protein